MKITELAELVKKAGHCTSKTADKDKEVTKCAAPKCQKSGDCINTCKVTGESLAKQEEKVATDLFGQPVKESDMDNKKEKAKASPDASDNPKGLPARPNNSNEKEAEADTAEIKVPTQSNDAVTGTGDGPEL